MSTKTDREGAEHLRFCKAAPPKANQPEALVPVEASQEHEKFEQWAQSQGFNIERGSRGLYKSLGTNQLFSGWLGRAEFEALTPLAADSGDLRQRLGEALTEVLTDENAAPEPDWNDAREIDRVIDAILPVITHLAAPQAAVDAARMLTPQEILQALVAELNAGVKHTPHEIVQRKFCEVNGIAIIPATGEGAQS